MLENEKPGANIPEGAAASLEAEESPTPEIQLSDEELVSTLDNIPVDTDPEGANNTEGPPDKDKGSKGDKGEPSSDGDGDKVTPDEDDTRFDKHPRFKELEADRDAAKERAIKAEARAEALEDLRREAPLPKGQEDLGYKDMSGMEDDELREMFDENPKGFLANFGKQIHHEIMAEVNTSRTAETEEGKVTRTLDEYAGKHADFDPMWKSGELQRFIRVNPGHNAISAHMALTSEKTAGGEKERTDAAVAKAVEETEAKVIKNFKAKGNSRVMGGGAGGRGVLSQDDEVTSILKDTKKAGGEVMAGVKALRIRQAQARGE